MDVLVIVGAKKDGHTDKLAGQFVKGARSAGHKVEVENLFEAKMTGCRGCESCQQNGGFCVLKDDVPKLLDKVLVADVLVFASPVYFFSVSSQLKAFMDRTYPLYGRLRDKKFYFISTAHGPAALHADKFRKVFGPLEGWLGCFKGMDFVKTLAHWDCASQDLVLSEAYREAERVGLGL